MNLDKKKIEIIGWVTQLNDQQAIDKLVSLKNKLSSPKSKSASKIYGSGKHLVEYIADDFNDPPLFVICNREPLS